ncbi:MAG: hypothetical protein HW386_876 [Gammaproteobacteria bacterium]|nr:hypothetical protein [Gammaproteobacteria bacterium]
MREARYLEHFTIQPRGQVHEEMLPLVGYLALAPGARENLQPYIDFVNDKQQQFIAVVSPAMAAVCATALHNWRMLQSQASGGANSVIEAAEPAATAPVMPTPDVTAANLSAYQQLSERLLELCGYKQDPEFFRQSLREFMLQDKTGNTTPVNPADV